MSAKTIKYLHRFSFILAVFVNGPNAYAVHQHIDQLANRIKHANQFENVPGYAFSVVKPDSKVTIVTAGNIKKGGKAIDENTLFRLASVSKTFTSVLTTKLVNQGQFTWSLALEDLLPNVPFKRSLAENMTLEHILSQSSGYIPNAYDNLIEANYSVERVIRELSKLEPICAPGECYTYQNAIFAAVDRGLTNHTKKSYQTLLDEQLFKPLKMQRASVGLQALIEDDNWARPHAMVRNGYYKQTTVKQSYYRYASASGINASIKDMGEWLKLMLGHYPEVLSKSDIEHLLTPKTKTTRELYRRHWREHLNAAHYGLGWRIYDFDGEKLVHHSGWVSGYRADVSFAPEHGIGLAVLMNAESNLINEISVDFWDDIFTSARNKAKKDNKQVTVAAR